MTREEARGKRQSAWDTFITVWGVAIIPNALDAFGLDLHGTGWDVIRLALAAAWFLALGFLIVAFVRERRTPKEADAGASLAEREDFEATAPRNASMGGRHRAATLALELLAFVVILGIGGIAMTPVDSMLLRGLIAAGALLVALLVIGRINRQGSAES